MREEERTKLKGEKDLSKTEKLKREIPKKSRRWQAGETSISSLTYAEKKNLFNKEDGGKVVVLPNLQGLEYYSNYVECR